MTRNNIILSPLIISILLQIYQFQCIAVTVTYTTKIQGDRITITPQIFTKVSPNVPLHLSLPTNVTFVNGKYITTTSTNITLEISEQTLVQPMITSNFYMGSAQYLNVTLGCVVGSTCHNIYTCNTKDINNKIASWNLTNNDISVRVFGNTTGTMYIKPSTIDIEMLIVIGDPFVPFGAMCNYIMLTEISKFAITSKGMLSASVYINRNYNSDKVYQISSVTKVGSLGIDTLEILPYDGRMDVLPNDLPINLQHLVPCPGLMMNNILKCIDTDKFLIKGDGIDGMTGCFASALTRLMGFIKGPNNIDVSSGTLQLDQTDLDTRCSSTDGFSRIIPHQILSLQYINNAINAKISTDYNITIVLDSFSIASQPDSGEGIYICPNLSLICIVAFVLLMF